MTFIPRTSLGIIVLHQIVVDLQYHVVKKLYNQYHSIEVLPMNKTKTMVDCKIFPLLIRSIYPFRNYGSVTMCNTDWNMQQRCLLC